MHADYAKSELLYRIGLGYCFVLSLPIPAYLLYLSPIQWVSSILGLLGGVLPLLALRIYRSPAVAAYAFLVTGITATTMSLVTFSNGYLELTICIWFIVHVLVAFFTLDRKAGIAVMAIILLCAFAVVVTHSMAWIAPYRGKLPPTPYDEIISLFMGFVFIGTAIDAYLKQQKQSNLELLHSNERLLVLTEIFNHTKENIQILDAKGNFIYANQSTLEALHISLEEIQKKNVNELMPDYIADHNLWNTTLDYLRVHGAKYSEREVISNDGKLLYTEVSSNLIRFNGLEFVLAFVRDIGEIRRLEKEKIDAEYKNKLKANFLSNMSHEIRTPMNAVMGLSNLLPKAGPLNERQKNYLDLIQVNSKNLLGIINDILDISKIEAGKIELEIRPFHLKDTVDAACAGLGTIIENKGVHFSIDWDQRIPDLVMGDSVRLGQVVANLVSNAGKFTQQGEVKVKVSKIAEANAQATVRFEITDTGVGIPADKIEHVFDAFEQAHSHTTREFGGTGLGLSIVKQLLALHNSSIQVESEVGKGSRFWFDLQLNYFKG